MTTPWLPFAYTAAPPVIAGFQANVAGASKLALNAD
jgi:hypothetical protein